MEVCIFNKCSRRYYNNMMMMMMTWLLCVEHLLWPILRSPSWLLALLGFTPMWTGPRARAETPGEAEFGGQDNDTNSPCSQCTYCVH